MRVAGLWLLALGVACRSDVNLIDPMAAYGEPNPAVLATPWNEDRVTQVTIPAVDVLFVVDNSCSMAEEQTALSVNFPSFLDWFLGSGLDYHIGVISTDMNNPLEAGRLREVQGLRWVDDATAQPASIFSQMVEMGVDGHWEEKGRAATYTAIELLKDDENLGFVREGAGMHITVVSDENDASGDSPVSRQEFVDFLNGLRWSERMVSFSSVVGPLTGCPYIGEPGTDYSAVTAQVGGAVWPICAEDWSAMLDELGFLAVGLSREFFLSRLPVPGTIEVSVDNDGVVVPFAEGTDWIYDPARNSVTLLQYVPDPLAVVVMRYQVLASQEQDPDDPGAPLE